MNQDLEYTLERYLDFLSANKNLSINTCKSYKNDIKGFHLFLKKKPINLINRDDVKNFIDFMSTNLSPNSQARKLSSLKKFFDFLCNRNILKNNVIENFDFPKIIRPIPKVLSESQIEQLINKSYENESPRGIRTTLFLELLYSTGIRVSELVGLKLSNIGEKKDSIIITGKGNKERFLPLLSKSKSLLIKYLKIRSKFVNNSKENGFLFPSSSKTGFITRNRFFQILKALAISSGIDSSKISPHIFRHSFASHLLDRGVDLRIIQESLGHKDIASTQIYTHVRLSKLNKVLKEKSPIIDKIPKIIKN